MLSPNLASQEQFLTIQRIRAAQGRYWIGRILGLWVLSSALILVLVLSWSPERKLHASSWAVANIARALRPQALVNWQGKKYVAGELANYLDARYYDGTFWDWLRWAGLVAVMPAVGIGLLIFKQVRQGKAGEQHIRGAELLELPILQKRTAGAGKGSLTIADVKIPQFLELRHVTICGATGAGKSVAIRDMLRQYEARGDVCIVVDPDGEMVSEFYNEERGDHLINPFDRRGIDWRPSYEGTGEADITAQAASLFPIIPGSSNAAQYYHDAARRIYRKLLQQDLDILPPNIATMLEDIGRVTKQFGISKELVSTLQNGCEFFRYIQPGTHRWSAREWVENPQGWVFLTFREADKAAALPFISLCLESLTRRLLSRPIDATPAIRVVIDELAVLKAQESLSDLLTRGRKRNVSVTIGFQDVNQLFPIYGNPLTYSILNQPSTRLLLNTNDSETQEWCSANIGRREVQRTEQTETVGPENIRDAFHLASPRRPEDTVMASEFGQMRPGEGILKVATFGAARVRVPLVTMVERVPAFIPREAESAGMCEVIQTVEKTVDLSPERRRW